MPEHERREQALNSVCISAVGMVTPVGSSAVQTCTSLRAQLSRKQELPDLYLCLADRPGFEPPEPVVASPVYHLDAAPRAEQDVPQWLGTLAGKAFGDMQRSAKLEPSARNRSDLFVALPSEMQTEAGDIRKQFLYHFYNGHGDGEPHGHL